MIQFVCHNTRPRGKSVHNSISMLKINSYDFTGFKQKYTDGKPLMIATILLVTPLLDVALLLAFLLLYLCGDIESNPGPPTGKYFVYVL